MQTSPSHFHLFCFASHCIYSVLSTRSPRRSGFVALIESHTVKVAICSRKWQVVGNMAIRKSKVGSLEPWIAGHNAQFSSRKSGAISQVASRKSQPAIPNSLVSSRKSQSQRIEEPFAKCRQITLQVASLRATNHKPQGTSSHSQKKKKKSQLASRKSPLPSPLAVPLLFPSRHLPLTRFAVRKFEGQLWPSQYANLPIKCRVEAILTTLG